MIKTKNDENERKLKKGGEKGKKKKRPEHEKRWERKGRRTIRVVGGRWGGGHVPCMRISGPHRRTRFHQDNRG